LLKAKLKRRDGALSWEVFLEVLQGDIFGARIARLGRRPLTTEQGADMPEVEHEAVDPAVG